MIPKRLTPLQAIKRYCRYSCCANDIKSWKECSIENCPLWYHRTGTRKILPKKHYFKQKHGVLKVNSNKNKKSQEVCE